MNYNETINYLFQKLPIYQRDGEVAYKKDIGNIVKASSILGNPHLNFPSIHIAGTNGKGSTAHMISSILQEAGYKVGLYTSPHLKDFRERIKINGKLISKNSIISFIDRNKIKFEKIKMSFFEMTVAMAFEYFSNKEVDIAIIETGLGGRLDSTNIIHPLLSIITNISMDHSLLLGNTIQEIAKEKAGIIKKETPIIIGKKQESCVNIFVKRAKELNSEIIFSERDNLSYKIDLKGEYQRENMSTATTVIKVLNRNNFLISETDITNGLLKVSKNTSLLGRWQILNTNPLIICDIAHNEDGIRRIIKQINNLNYEKLHFVFGTVNDKNIGNILCLLPKNAKYYFCEANIPRAMNKQKLYNQAMKHNLHGNIYSSVKEAFLSAKNNSAERDCIFVGGSTFVVAEII